jgi:hypothetical protein
MKAVLVGALALTLAGSALALMPTTDQQCERYGRTAQLMYQRFHEHGLRNDPQMATYMQPQPIAAFQLYMIDVAENRAHDALEARVSVQLKCYKIIDELRDRAEHGKSITPDEIRLYDNEIDGPALKR